MKEEIQMIDIVIASRVIVTKPLIIKQKYLFRIK